MGTLRILSFVLTGLLVGCSRESPTISQPTDKLPPRLNSYFERYCDYTGSLGIGFVPSHTYDYRFRQHLKTTKDPELQRLYVLKNLHEEVERSLDDLKAGIMRTGKNTFKPLTISEWDNAQQSIHQRIDDLATYTAFTNFVIVSGSAMEVFDIESEKRRIEELRGRLRGITNATPAEPSVKPTG